MTTSPSTASGANTLRFDLDEQPRGAYLREKEVAAALNVSARTLQHWRYSGKGPEWVRFERHVRSRVSAVLEWIEAQRG